MKKNKSDELNWEALQEKLEGVFDFNKVDDCHQVIQSLVKDLKHARSQAEATESSAKMLALLVTNGREPQAKAKAKEILTGVMSSNGTVLDFLKKMSETMDAAEEMTDSQLVDEVMDKVWSDLNANSIEAAVLEELIERFKKASKPVATKKAKK